MPENPQIEALHEWTRIAQENTENALVGSMFEATQKAVEPVDTFSTWLLVGTAAVASFLIGNAEKLIPIVGKVGFLTCGLLLCLSCLFGLLSKMFALSGRVGFATGEAVRKALPLLLEKHDLTETEIQSRALALGLTVDSGIRMERVMREFLAPLPRFIQWFVARHLNKNAGNPQIGYLAGIRNLNRQGLFAFFQSVLFLAFLTVAFSRAAAF